jgi:hypothetical protein
MGDRMVIRTTEWVEVEPGAPLPAEALPGAERHDRVESRELSGPLRRAAIVAGAVILAGAAGTVLLREWRGLAAVPLGLALVFAGWSGGARRTVYVPSAEGRYVLAEIAVEVPADDARERWEYVVTPLVWVGVAAALIANGARAEQVIPSILVMFCATSTPEWIRSWRSRSESEAVASERFRQVSDPRLPLPADTFITSLPESAQPPSPSSAAARAEESVQPRTRMPQ